VAEIAKAHPDVAHASSESRAKLLQSVRAGYALAQLEAAVAAGVIAVITSDIARIDAPSASQRDAPTHRRTTSGQA
jgi:hypothetical protein